MIALMAGCGAPEEDEEESSDDSYSPTYDYTRPDTNYAGTSNSSAPAATAGVSNENLLSAFRNIAFLIRQSDVSDEDKERLYEAWLYMKQYYDGTLTAEEAALLTPEKRADYWHTEYLRIKNRVKKPEPVSDAPATLLPSDEKEAAWFGALQGKVVGESDAYNVKSSFSNKSAKYDENPRDFWGDEKYRTAFMAAYKSAYRNAYYYYYWFDEGYLEGASDGELDAQDDRFTGQMLESNYDVKYLNYTGPPEWANAYRDGYVEGYNRVYEGAYYE
jgi:hypothetical protein